MLLWCGGWGEMLWCWGVVMLRCWGGEMLRCWGVEVLRCDVDMLRCDVEVLRYALLMSTQHHLTISPPLLYKVSNYFYPSLIMSPIFFTHWNVKVNFARSGGLRPPQHQVHSVKSCILNTTTRYKVISVIDCCGGRRPPLRFCSRSFVLINLNNQNNPANMRSFC